MSDHTVRCWGANESGELGDGTTTWRMNPAPVAGLSNVAEIASGGEASHVCARLMDGTMRCWGENSYGQIGTGSTAGMLRTPSAVTGLTNVAHMALSATNTCAVLTDGTVRCWGLNDHGQLGGTSGGSCTVSGTTYRCSRTPITVAGLSGATEIAVGDSHACAIATGSTLHCWGSNALGQLGGTNLSGATDPSTVLLTGVRHVAAGSLFTCVVFADRVQCAGANALGETGVPSTQSCGTDGPCVVGWATVPRLGGTAQISLGSSTACAREVDGTARCWGDNRWGQLGNGSTAESQMTPSPVMGLIP
jgi:alpha-tubulin suppressor-like RCC1 family protein